MLADQWPIPSNVTALKVPESDANALSPLAYQQCRMEYKLVQTNTLLGKPLFHSSAMLPDMPIPWILLFWIPIKMLMPTFICSRFPGFNYLIFMSRDLISDKLNAVSLQKTVKDKNKIGDKLFATNIVDMVQQFKEYQRHVNPKWFRAKRAN